MTVVEGKSGAFHFKSIVISKVNITQHNFFTIDFIFNQCHKNAFDRIRIHGSTYFADMFRPLIRISVDLIGETCLKLSFYLLCQVSYSNVKCMFEHIGNLCGYI